MPTLQHRSDAPRSTAESRGPSSRLHAASLPKWSIENRANGWPATLELVFAERNGTTRLVDQRHRGPLRIQRPFYPEGPRVCHVYLLHPPAGIVGGDDIRIRAAVASEAHALVTTPGATRFYRSKDAEAQLQQIVRVSPGSSLEWLPQETLFMRGARAKTVSRIELEGDARFFGWETLGFGRPALGEAFTQGELETRLEIYRDGRPLLLDCFRVEEGRLEGLLGHSAVTTLVATGANEVALEATRAVLEGASESRMAATLMDDLLVVRGVAQRCEPLFKRCVEIWRCLRPVVLDRPAAAPRIWLT